MDGLHSWDDHISEHGLRLKALALKVSAYLMSYLLEVTICPTNAWGNVISSTQDYYEVVLEGLDCLLCDVSAVVICRRQLIGHIVGSDGLLEFR